MDERMLFIVRLLDGEAMAGLCREFGISRKTGHRLWKRYRECGFDALNFWIWWLGAESNCRPSGYESDALTN